MALLKSSSVVSFDFRVSSMEMVLKPVGCSSFLIPVALIDNPVMFFFIRRKRRRIELPTHDERLKSSNSSDVYPRLSPYGGT